MIFLNSLNHMLSPLCSINLICRFSIILIIQIPILLIIYIWQRKLSTEQNQESCCSSPPPRLTLSSSTVSWETKKVFWIWYPEARVSVLLMQYLYPIPWSTGIGMSNAIQNLIPWSTGISTSDAIFVSDTLKHGYRYV